MSTLSVQRWAVEMRAEVTGRRLTGHAAVFNRTTNIGDLYGERIDPHAFDQLLARSDLDVRALWNHEPDMVLGRTTAGTLELDTDRRGLRFRAELPDTQYATDLLELVRRGDVTGASFGFIPGREEWTDGTKGRQIRTHLEIAELRDVGPVTFPAYPTTDVAVRAAQAPTGARLRAAQITTARARARATTRKARP